MSIKKLSEKGVYPRLETPFEKDTQCTWADTYPRPTMERDSFFSLTDGQWSLEIISKKGIKYSGSINMPFVPESRLSGVNCSIDKGDTGIYRTRFTLPEGFNKGRVLLNIGAFDSRCEVYLNGRKCSEGDMPYHSLQCDLTEYLEEKENLLEIKVWDDLSPDVPYGKQRKKHKGMWYTPVSGIWQSVWLESVPESYIRRLKITADTRRVRVECEGGRRLKTLKIDNGELYTFEGDSFEFAPENGRLWSPDDPFLYTFTLSDGEDEIRSYFALREIGIEKRGEYPRICLNGSEIFLNAVLDQGYFSDGIFLPASPKGYLWDIMKMKELGFNTLRKHIKIEPEIFYHYCDKYGMIVFQDTVNNGRYSFVRDTALPTVGIKKEILPRRNTKRQKENYIACAEMTVERLHNHPSVCLYTLFNEGWGQFESDKIYDRMKRLDPTRLYDSTSGWFAGKRSDFDSEHVYFRKIDLKAKGKRALILSEFGGYSCPVSGHRYNEGAAYGYKALPDPQSFQDAIEELYITQVIPCISKGLCAAVLTQLSDVEDEINGLVTYDRQVIKADAERMRRISKLCCENKNTNK